MTGTQLHMEFAVHRRQNNPESQAHFDCNSERFGGQNKVVYEYLMQGNRLTCHEAQNRFHIGDLRPRIATLRKAGVLVKDEFLKTQDGKRTRYKEYFIEQKSNK